MKNLVAVDIETYDPNLKDLGNGAIRKDGHIICMSLHDGETTRTFIPQNPIVKAELQALFADPNRVWIAHNGVYDYDWIQNGLGIHIAGRMEDTMTRAGLINEYAGHYDLDACCLREGIIGKNKDDTIQTWWQDKGGQGDVMKNLLLLPIDVVSKYNQQDAIATWQLYQAQQDKIVRMKLEEANQLECEQFPIILEMRRNGIRIDVPMVDRLRTQTLEEVASGLYELQRTYGLESLGARKGAGSLPEVLRSLGLEGQLLKTPKGELSVSADSLIQCDHPITTAVLELKRKQTLLDKYLNSAFVKFCVGDRIHGTFKPTQRDDGGTITGRYASSDPNMQNFSAREYKSGDLVRGVFIPDEGSWLAKLDYSQIEYRLFAHFAVGPGSTKLRDDYCKGGTDYHQLVQDMLGWKGKGIRRIVKNFNFGMIYGMGVNTFKQKHKLEAREAASAMGMTTDQYTDHYYKEYLRKLTFVKPTTMAIQAVAQREQQIRSIGGRLHRNPPDGHLYKMTNYLIQGSAADINKMGLRDAWKSGIFNTLKLHLTVHDEVVCSVPKNKE